MERQATTTHITLWLNRAIGALIVVLLPTTPMILEWVRQYREVTNAEGMAMLIAFYFCAVATAPALWNMDKLLRNILRDKVFVRENVTCIRWVRWCCAAISLICIPAAYFYLPLILMTIIMGFLSLVITVVVRVMNAAVLIREENDLTI